MTGLAAAETLVVAAGVVTLFGGNRYSNAASLSTGLVLIGSGFSLGGVEAIATRRFSFWRSYGRESESDGGLATLVWGID